MEEEIDLYFFRCYDEDKYDQRRVKMKKILASLMMVWTYFLSWWMQRSMDETKDRENEGCEVIQADKLKEQ